MTCKLEEQWKQTWKLHHEITMSKTQSQEQQKIKEQYLIYQQGEKTKNNNLEIISSKRHHT